MANHPLTPEELRSIDAVCDEFELHWRNGARPRVEDYVERVPSRLMVPLLDALLPLIRELLLKHRADPPTPAPNDRARAKRAESSDELPAARLPMGRLKDEPEAIVKLKVIAGRLTGQTFEYRKHVTLVAGRSNNAQLQLHDDHVSRHHFRLEINPPACYLLDLGSLNGTCINDVRVDERLLQDGDVIAVGETKLQVMLRGQPFDPTHAPRADLDQLAKTDLLGADGLPGYELMSGATREDFGVSYRGRDKASGDGVVIKILRPSSGPSAGSRPRFMKELAELKSLRHPHLVALREFRFFAGMFALIYDAASDATVAEVLQRQAAYRRPRIACRLACQILSALSYAHAANRVHRDIKPGAVSVIVQDGNPLAMLADFGIAKSYSDAGFSQVVSSNEVLGGLPYLAPEQFVDSRTAWPTVDIYAMGAVLYEWIAETTPHEFSDRRSPFLAILEDDAIPLRQRRSDLPAGLTAAVDRALSRDPRDRHSSAAAMLAAIEPFAL